MKYSLSSQSVFIMRGLLNLPGSCTSIDEIYRGGRLLAAVLPEVKNEKLTTDEQRDRPIEVDLTPDDCALVKKAITFGMAKEALPASKYLNEILVKLEFVKPDPAPEPAKP